MNRIRLPYIALFVAIVWAYTPSFAQDSKQSSTVSVALVASKVITENGKESLVSGEKAKPGDTLEYRATCHNGTGGPVKNLQPIVPIPAGLVYLPGSQTPASAQASLDGKSFSSIPLMRAVKKADGTTEKVKVPAGEYRAVRWTIPELAADGNAIVSVRAKVSSNP